MREFTNIQQNTNKKCIMRTNERRKGFKDFNQQIGETTKVPQLLFVKDEENRNTNKAFTSLNVYES